MLKIEEMTTTKLHLDPMRCARLRSRCFVRFFKADGVGFGAVGRVQGATDTTVKMQLQAA